MATPTEREQIIEGSGNVFADLGFENPEEELAKSKLVSAISEAIDAKGLAQAKLAEMIGIDQPQVSKLLRGRTEGYSTDRLIRILNLLGQDVEIRVRKKPASAKRPGHLVVVTPAAQSGMYISETKRKYRGGE